MATYRIEDYRKAGLPQEAERRMARIVELSSGLGYGAAEDRRNHKQFLEMIYKIKFDPKMETFTTPNAARSTNSVDPKRMIAYIKKIVSSINLKAFTGAHGPEIRYNGIPWEYGVALNPYSPEEVVVSAHTWKDAPKDDIKDMEEKVKRDTAKLVSKLNASGFSATPRFYSQTKVPIYILGEISAQHKGQNSGQPEGASACNAAGYVDASSVVLHPGDAVVFKAQYSSHKDDDEWLERNGDTVREVRGNVVKIGPSANDWAKKSDLMVWHNAARACNSTNPIVRKAMNATALNYSPYRKGGWLHDDKGANYTVVEEEHWGKNGGAERFVTIRDEQTKQTKEVAVTELAHRFHMGEAEACAKCGNSEARNAVGRDKQDAGEVETWVNMFRNFIDWHLPKYKDMEKARKSGEQIIKYVEACLGSEGGKAQLRKMGWTIQKMRETMEKAIASRKGSNASCNAARSRNAVVQKALNAATARNFTPTSEFEVGDKVRFRDSVRSVPHDETYTVVKVSGKNITIKGGRDGGTSVEFANNLEPVFNAATARNADNPHDIDAYGKKLVKGDWVRFLKDMPDVKRGECAVVKYALPGGLIFSTLAGAREISWDASVVEKMPPIPRSLSQIDAWKKGPRA